MRHWLLMVLIVLLPLRGWAGATMAVGMPLAPGSVSASAPCADHLVGLELAHATGEAGAVEEDPLSHSHSLCDVCNGPAMADVGGQMIDPLPLPQARRVAGRVDFISAVPQRGQKPPIA